MAQPAKTAEFQRSPDLLSTDLAQNYFIGALPEATYVRPRPAIIAAARFFRCAELASATPHTWTSTIVFR
jgi:hypothetical protein